MQETEEIKVELTDKQERFCYEYCVDLNGTQAAIRAGYSGKTARSIAAENLAKPYIAQRIKELQDDLAQTAGITKLKILTEHMKLAFSSIANLHNTWIKRKDFEKLTSDQKACIAEIDTKIKVEYEYNPDNPKEKKSINVEYIRIKLYDKQKALDSISKMLGYDAPTQMKVDLTVQSLPPVVIQGIND